jgi:hypothetical protein
MKIILNLKYIITMKKLLGILLILCFHLSNGQTIEGETIKLVESVIEIQASQAEIHEKIKNWFGKAFKSAKTVITSDTQSSITGRYINGFVFGGTAPVDWNHSIEVDIKDNKARIRIWLVDNDPVNYFYNKQGEQRGMYKKGFTKLIDDAKALESNFKEFLTNPAKDDW